MKAKEDKFSISHENTDHKNKAPPSFRVDSIDTSFKATSHAKEAESSSYSFQAGFLFLCSSSFFIVYYMVSKFYRTSYRSMVVIAGLVIKTF